MFFFIQLGISYDPMHAVRISKPGLTSQWSTTSRTRTLWVHESDLLSANDDGTAFAWQFFVTDCWFHVCLQFTICVFNTSVFFRWIAEYWGESISKFCKFAPDNLDDLKCLRWIRCWTSFGLKVQWQHVQRTTFRCIGTAICCPGPLVEETQLKGWTCPGTCESEWWVGGCFCCRGYYIQLGKTSTDSSLKNGKKASTQDRKKWRVTGLFGNLQLMIQQHLLKTSVYRFQEHVSSSKHLLQLARVL